MIDINPKVSKSELHLALFLGTFEDNLTDSDLLCEDRWSSFREFVSQF